MARLVFHIDVNSAFLSWEAMRRVKNGEADIRLIPSAIGGDRESRRGVILAKSIPAKKYGVKTGEPIAMALRKCPDLYITKPDFSLYSQCSHAFMDICRKYAPIVEVYSIDECFLDMSGTSRLYPDPIEIARTIKDEIRDTLGFTVNVGIGSNKLLAKMASDFEKPDKVHTLFTEEIPTKLWPLPAHELFSLGRSAAERLYGMHIRTIGELAATDVADLRTVFGVKMGEHLHRYANGIDTSPVLAESEEAKGYGNSTTLAKDLTTAEEAYPILLSLADSCASRMRNDGQKATCVSVTIRDTAFRDRSHQQHLSQATDITSEIYEVSCRLFDDLWDRKMPLRLLGVSLSQLTREDAAQLSMFPDPKREREQELDRLIDGIRHRFGSDTIVRGSIMEQSRRVGKKHKAALDLEKKE